MSYAGHSLGESYLSIETQLVYSTALTVWKIVFWGVKKTKQNKTAVVGRVFANGLGDLGSISGQIIPKTQKTVLDTFLLNTQQYKVRIKGKVEQSWERSSVFPYTSV